MKREFRIGLLLILTAGAVLAQAAPTQSTGDSLGNILIAQAAVSNTTDSKQQRVPQVLPPLPQPEGTSPSPQSETVASPAPSPQIPSLDQLDKMFKQSSLGKEADEVRMHQQWREVSNSVIKDPDLIAARTRAEAAKTDLLKRQRMRVYYIMYYDRMRAKATSPELKNYIDARKAEHLLALAQNKVRPIPSPSPSASPARR